MPCWHHLRGQVINRVITESCHCWPHHSVDGPMVAHHAGHVQTSNPHAGVTIDRGIYAQTMQYGVLPDSHLRDLGLDAVQHVCTACNIMNAISMYLQTPTGSSKAHASSLRAGQIPTGSIASWEAQVTACQWATQVTCDTVLHSMYMVNSNWHAFLHVPSTRPGSSIAHTQHHHVFATRLCTCTCTGTQCLP